MIHAVLMFLSMLVLQLFVMPLVMIDNTSDFRVSLNQIYGAVFMASAMILIESIYTPMPAGIWFLLITLAAASYIGIRKQLFINDREYLKDMIPHHSMAVLTSRQRMEKGQDSTVLAIAEGILRSQQSEITTMKNILIK